MFQLLTLLSELGAVNPGKEVEPRGTERSECPTNVRHFQSLDVMGIGSE